MTHKTGRMQQITKTKNNQTVKNTTQKTDMLTNTTPPPPPIKKGKEKVKKGMNPGAHDFLPIVEYLIE